MEMKRYIFFSVVIGYGLTCSAQVVAPGAELQLVSAGFKFTEGPAVDAQGNVFFTDPYYQRDYWARSEPMMQSQALYRYDTDGTLTRLDDAFRKPNGIIGTPDGKYLYVADIGDRKIYRYAIQADGSVADRRFFAPQGSDGMTIDERGNIYLTGKGIDVYSPDGQHIQHIDVPVNWTANACFGGRDRDFLFITATDKVFTLKMAVKGVR